MQINKINSAQTAHQQRNKRNINSGSGNSAGSSASQNAFKGSFKGGGLIEGVDSFCLWLANIIEYGGLVISFTLQDMLGTNLPRPLMGLFRNQKENHGQRNMSFAAKEFVREFLTGPSMFIIPGVMLGASKKIFGKACEIPAKFIKAFSGIHAQNAENYTKQSAKQDFYKDTFAQIIKNAKGEETPSADTLKTAAEYASSLSDGVKGGKKALKEKIEFLFDNFSALSKKHAADSAHTDFTAAKTAEGAVTSFKKTVSYMISYADDIAVKAADAAPDKVKEFISNTADKKIIGRFALNTLMYSSVMAFLWLIPKLYNAAEGSKNSGLKGLMQEETFNSKGLSPDKTDAGKDAAPAELNTGLSDAKTSKLRASGNIPALSPVFAPAFGASFTNKIADKLTGTGAVSSFAEKMEFDGLNVSFPQLLGVMGGGILAPRILRAKDKYDKKEIKRRDYVTCGVMCFGAKWLEKGFSKFNEMKSGFVLASKDPNFKNKDFFGKLFDYFKPVNGVRMLSSDYIRAAYSNIDSYKNGIQGFCNFITEQGGSLAKVFSLTDKSKEITSQILGRDISGLDNKTIADALSNPKNKDAVKKLTDLFKEKDNAWVNRARTLNARFTTLSVVVLVPLFLGFMLPWINERATKKSIREEQAALEAQKAASAAAGASGKNRKPAHSEVNKTSSAYSETIKKGSVFSDIAQFVK